MNKTLNDKGYALYLTLVIVILFSVLGMTMLALTSDGMKKNNTRKENIQATAQAERGIERIVGQINSELTTAIGTDGLTRNDFSKKLITILNNYKCVGPNSGGLNNQTSNTGKFNVCIENILPIVDSVYGEESELRKLAIIKSQGFSDDSNNKTLLAKIELGAEAFPETMKYAIGTNIMSKNPQKGEGNLLLHGSSDIQGDLKVDGNLISYNYGTAAYRWIPSLYTRTTASKNSSSSKLVLGKSMYKVESNPSSNGSQKEYDTYKESNSFSGNKFSKETDPKQIFDEGFAPRIVKRDPTFSLIEIKDHYQDYFFDHTSNNVETVELTNNYFNNYRNSIKDVTPIKCGNNKCSQKSPYGSFSLYNTNTFKRLSSSNDLTFRYGKHTFSEGLYVNRDLIIGNGVQTDNPEKRDDIEIKGTMYINRNLIIQGANLKSDALLYVDGDVTIKFSTVNGLPTGNGNTGSLIIFATGDIYISNNSVDLDTPSKIKGFFYSQNNFEMYGVGSNVRIEGGISARRIILNAVRGKSSSSSYDSVSTQRSRNSRLQVIYDAELIENFLKLNKPEPIIRKVDPALERSRELK